MNITSTTIRKSAENLIKSKGRIEKMESSQGLGNPSQNEDSVSFGAHIAGRYILLQNQLNSLQSAYTREQTRLSLLENNTVTDEEIVNILYGGTPLFTESLEEMIHEKANLLVRIKAQKEQIADQIKALEIELENIFSMSPKESLKDLPRTKINLDAMKPLDVKVVEKLIRG
jgi:hypothetical protein